MKILAIALAVLITSTAAAQNEAQEILEIENTYIDLADKLARSHAKYGACAGAEVYTSDIVDATKKARLFFDANWEYNEVTHRKFKISNNTTQALKETLALKDIMNMLDHNDPQTFEDSLNRVIMWGPAPGVLGNATYLKFSTDNNLIFAEIELLESAPYYQWKETPGTFSVTKKDQKIVVTTMIKGVSTEYNLAKYGQGIKDMWHLQDSSASSGSAYLNGFVDYPDECSA